MITPNMNLNLPTPTVTLGPAWASQLNSALSLVDNHDHTSGKGQRIPAAGLNINADLPLNSNNLNLVRSLRFNNQGATLSSPGDVRNVYVVGGDLYYNNASGVAVQLTDGASPAAAPAGASVNYSRFASSSSVLNITPAVQYSYVELDVTSNAITVNLPAANGVSAGRFFIFKDIAGNAGTNNITINAAGSDEIDGASSVLIDVDLDSLQLISNGADAWSLFRTANKSVSAAQDFSSAVNLVHTGYSDVISTPSLLPGNYAITVSYSLQYTWGSAPTYASNEAVGFRADETVEIRSRLTNAANTTVLERGANISAPITDTTLISGSSAQIQADGVVTETFYVDSFAGGVLKYRMIASRDSGAITNSVQKITIVAQAV